MAATIPNDQWGDLIFKPYPTGCPPDVKNLGNMKFDKDHYQRYYVLCRGGGGTHDQCKQVPTDEHVTAPNPSVTAFRKSIFDGIECMGDQGDINKCLHHTEFMTKKFEYEEPAPGTVAKGKALLDRMGSKAWGIPVVFGARWLLKL